jgi:ABC-type branched-subunit amino acid transport system substrate-binding protein
LASASTLNSPQAQQFKSLLGITSSEAAKLKGKTFKIGAILPLTGPGSQYAVEEQNGVLLANYDMEHYLGMNIQYQAEDHKSGNPAAGAQASRALGVAGYGVAINSYYADFGADLPGIETYHMLSFDPGGGTGNSLKGKPYFYGFRAETPDAGFVALKYIKQKDPSIKRVAMVVWDIGAAYIDPIKAHLQQAAAANGMSLVGSVTQPVGTTNYSSEITALKTMNPQLIWLVSFATDPAYFMKGYVSSGLHALVMGSEYTQAAAQVAGPTYNKLLVSADYFEFSNPPNPLSKFFITDYTGHFGKAPDTFYEPNYYETTLAYLQLATRVLDKGGDINSGQQLNQALLSDPSFKSVYGGTPSTVGTLTVNATTHDVEQRPVGLFVASPDPSQVKKLAEWNANGADFTITPAGQSFNFSSFTP